MECVDLRFVKSLALQQHFKYKSSKLVVQTYSLMLGASNLAILVFRCVLIRIPSNTSKAELKYVTPTLCFSMARKHCENEAFRKR